MLCLWCYRYNSGIVLDHSIILIWILDPQSRTIIQISTLDLPFRFVQQLVTSPLPNNHMNRSMTAVTQRASRMCIIFMTGIGCRISIVNGHSLSAGNLIPSHQTHDDSLILKWSISNEMKCHQYKTTMASRDMQSHIGNTSLTNNHYITALSTKWTYTNQSLPRPPLLGLGK